MDKPPPDAYIERIAELALVNRLSLPAAIIRYPKLAGISELEEDSPEYQLRLEKVLGRLQTALKGLAHRFRVSTLEEIRNKLMADEETRRKLMVTAEEEGEGSPPPKPAEGEKEHLPVDEETRRIHESPAAAPSSSPHRGELEQRQDAAFNMGYNNANETEPPADISDDVLKSYVAGQLAGVEYRIKREKMALKNAALNPDESPYKLTKRRMEEEDDPKSILRRVANSSDVNSTAAAATAAFEKRNTTLPVEEVVEEEEGRQTTEPIEEKPTKADVAYFETATPTPFAKDYALEKEKDQTEIERNNAVYKASYERGKKLWEETSARDRAEQDRDKRRYVIREGYSMLFPGDMISDKELLDLGDEEEMQLTRKIYRMMGVRFNMGKNKHHHIAVRERTKGSAKRTIRETYSRPRETTTASDDGAIGTKRKRRAPRRSYDYDSSLLKSRIGKKKNKRRTTSASSSQKKNKKKKKTAAKMIKKPRSSAETKKEKEDEKQVIAAAAAVVASAVLEKEEEKEEKRRKKNKRKSSAAEPHKKKKKTSPASAKKKKKGVKNKKKNKSVQSITSKKKKRVV